MTMPGLGGQLACVMLAVVVGCTGTEVGNPARDIEALPLSLVARSTDTDVTLDGPSATASVMVEEVWVVLGDIRFVLDDDCGSDRDTRVSVPGPIVGEIAHEPVQLDAQVVGAAYCRVRVPLDRLGEAHPGAPPELARHSILIRGRRADDTPFRIRSRSKADLELRSRDEPFDLPEATGSLILAFDTAVWLSGIDLAAATPDSEGEVVIDAGHEARLLRAFDSNLRRSLALFRDVDADGALDLAETATPLAE